MLQRAVQHWINHQHDVPAQYVIQSLCAALVSNVLHGGFGHHIEQAHAQIRLRGGRGIGQGRIFLGQLQKLGRCVGRQRGVGINGHVKAGELHHPRQVFERVVRQLGAQQNVGHMRAGDHAQHMPIGC